MKILYIMQVDWNWIKQRPQYIAELLSKDNEVRVLYPFQRKRKKLCNNSKGNVSLIPIYQIPFQGRMTGLKRLSDIYSRKLISKQIVEFEPDLIWLCSPVYIKFIPKGNYKIVFDCMDDYYAMSHNNDGILSIESRACEVADIILTSSKSLTSKLVSRHGISTKKIHLVRNGYDAKMYHCEMHSNDRFHIGYIGTVSEWFDFEKVKYITEKFGSVIFDIFGPYSEQLGKAYSSDRIVFHGTIEHDQIYEQIKKIDCLIMPFKVNEIVESVDPVKLYEYMSFYKNIVSVKYDEIERFEPYVFFYSNADELSKCVEDLLKDNSMKYSVEQQKMFLSKNTWKCRVDEINSIINTLQ